MLFGVTRELRRPCSLRRGGAVACPPRAAGPSFAPPAKKARGWSAERRYQVSAVRRGAPCDKRARHSALHVRLFRPRRRTSGQDAGGARYERPLSGGLPPAFVPAASSHQRQPVVMPADGWPGPPGREAANLARGRRPCPTPRTPLEAPLMGRWLDDGEGLGRNYGLYS
jgi:hypothetical protein